MDPTTCEVRTRAGSNVRIFERTEQHIFGAYDDGTGVFYPIRWHSNGRLWKDLNYTCSLDLCL